MDAHLDATLRDGTRVRCRQVRPTDREAFARAFERLSPRARELRFHTPMHRLSAQQLRYLTDVDGHDHVAWVAASLDEPGLPVVGVARFIRLRDEPEVAEAAVTVVDDHQGRGLGTLLLGLLTESARRHGVERFRSYVLDRNPGMLAVFDRLGAVRELEDHGVWRVDVTVPSGPDELRSGPAGRMLRAAARAEHVPYFHLLRAVFGPDPPAGDA